MGGGAAAESKEGETPSLERWRTAAGRRQLPHWVVSRAAAANAVTAIGFSLPVGGGGECDSNYVRMGYVLSHSVPWAAAAALRVGVVSGAAAGGGNQSVCYEPIKEV